jgi:hypothetical protein
VVETLDAGQDNVVFMGRRSFRMELAGTPARGELEHGQAIPMRSSEIPTEKIFDSDRKRSEQAFLATLRPRESISTTTLVTLCSTTFVLGIALTLMVSGRPEPRPPIEAAPAAPTPPAVVAALPAPPAEPVVVSLPPPALPSMLRPALSRPARAIRPRPVRVAQPVSAPVKPWVDPFAE